MAERPQGPASRIDAVPCCPRLGTEGDEVADDRRTALPVVQQDRTQATPDMSIESAQHELLAGRDDPEVLVPSPQPRVDPQDAPLKGPSPQSRRELTDLRHRHALGALGEQNLHGSSLRV